MSAEAARAKAMADLVKASSLYEALRAKAEELGATLKKVEEGRQ